MNIKKIVYQSPSPKVLIKDPNTGKVKITFSVDMHKVLQSYQFSLSKQDINGSFTLTFFPQMPQTSQVHYIDYINKLDIVEIYEGKLGQNVDKPVFTGIIKTKKYVTQVTDNGATRRFSVSGTAITGLVSQFYINLDPTAMAITKQYAENEAIRNGLTEKFLQDKKWKLSEVVNTIWDYFNEGATNNLEGHTTTKIRDYIKTFIGDSPFDVDTETELRYKIGCVFNGNATQDFYSIIDGIIPQPVYEKFAYTGTDGKMRIKIRQVQFDADKWTGLTKHELKATKIKSFDVTESDNEVYTVFFSYVDGSAIEVDKALKVVAMQQSGKKEGVSSSIGYDSKKYAIYGYRPLIAHFLGYGIKQGSDDESIESDLTELNNDLKNWFGNLDEMLSGTITLAMTYDDALIMPGEVVQFLGGEFYVEGISHNWNYGSNGEVSLSVSRGGKYTSGTFSKFEKVSDVLNLLNDGEVIS